MLCKGNLIAILTSALDVAMEGELGDQPMQDSLQLLEDM